MKNGQFDILPKPEPPYTWERQHCYAHCVVMRLIQSYSPDSRHFHTSEFLDYRYFIDQEARRNLERGENG